LGSWQEETSQLQTPRWDSKASSFFLGSSPCHAEDQQRLWNGPSATKGTVFFSMLSIHSFTLVAACTLSFMCILEHRHGPAFILSLSLMCRCSLSSSLDQPQRTTALATSRNKMRERFPFHCSNSVDKRRGVAEKGGRRISFKKKLGRGSDSRTNLLVWCQTANPAGGQSSGGKLMPSQTLASSVTPPLLQQKHLAGY
jgi:hypothetical protein